MSVLEAEAPVSRNTHEKFHKLIATAQQHPPVKVAVAHPCDQVSLESVVEAARLKLIEPILVGPQERIREVAAQARARHQQLRNRRCRIQPGFGCQGGRLVREGRAEALMKGSLHTDEMMGAVVKRDTGLRTSRRISHCFIMDVPDHDQPLDHHRRGGEHRADLKDQGRHHPERDRSRPGAGAERCPRRDSERDGNASIPTYRRPLRRRPCARWQTGDRSPGRCSTARWRSTMRSAPKLRRSRRLRLRSPAAPMFWSFRISRPATCSPRACRSWPARTPPVSSLAQRCRSS